MSGQVRDPNSKSLTRIKTHLNNIESEPEIEDNKMVKLEYLMTSFIHLKPLHLHVLIYWP